MKLSVFSVASSPFFAVTSLFMLSPATLSMTSLPRKANAGQRCWQAVEQALLRRDVRDLALELCDVLVARALV